MGEQAEHAPFWGPSVEDQRSGDVVSYLHHLGAALQDVHDPIAQGGVETQGLSYSQWTAFLHRYSSCPDGIGQCAAWLRVHHLWTYWGCK
jgi:hypothetical protein